MSDFTTGENQAIRLRFTAEINVSPEQAADKQREIAATLGRISGVAVTVEQVDLAQLVKEEAEKQRILDLNVTKIAWPDGSKSLISRTTNALQREGLPRLRDVLVAGKAYVADRDQLGGKTEDLLEGAISLNLGKEVAWFNHPSAEDIASFCTELSQIAAVAVDSRLRRIEYKDGVFELTKVSDLVNMSLDRIASQFTTSYRSQGIADKIVDYNLAAELQAKIRKFAEQFAEARNQHQDR